MLRCADRSYYVGHPDDLERRIAAHRSGEIEGYTHSRRPVLLVWSQDFTTRIEALTAERQIKGWAQRKKEASIRGDWKAIRPFVLSSEGRPAADQQTAASIPTTTPPTPLVLRYRRTFPTSPPRSRPHPAASPENRDAQGNLPLLPRQ
jgi:predicted GIY-YIG superfamily endonuclease